MNGTNYEVPHCGAFSTPHSHPSCAQILAFREASTLKEGHFRLEETVIIYQLELFAEYLTLLR